MIVGALAIITAGIGAAVILRRPQLSATEQLSKAEKSKGSDRVSGLVALATLPDATDAQLVRAGALLVEAREWDALLSLVDGWLVKSPRNLDARLLEAKAAAQTRKGKRAEAAVKEAGAIAPNDARPDALMAELRELQADSSGALESWNIAVSKAPGNAQYLARQGYWLSQGGRLDEAEVALTKSSKKHNDPATTAELGFVKYRKDQKEEAMRLLRSVVRDKPDLLEGHYYLATVLFQKNDLAAARSEYLAADALAGTDSRPLTALCEMEQMQRTSELPTVKKKIRERFPKEADTLLSKCAASAPPP